MRLLIGVFVAICVAGLMCVAVIPLVAQTGSVQLVGAVAFGDWRTDHPGTQRLIRPQDLPAPDLAASVGNYVRIVHRTNDQKPIVPNGFEVNLFASGLAGPRLIRVAPNGDVFAAESNAGRIRALRPNGTQASEASVFASGLDGPFGIAFYPPSNDPQWVYVGNTDSVVRFPYRTGDLTPRGPAEVIVPQLPTGGHHTRDVVFSPDGKTMYVSVGSASNVGDRMGS
jgi:glucose/arabinose dehydrogenase